MNFEQACKLFNKGKKIINYTKLSIAEINSIIPSSSYLKAVHFDGFFLGKSGKKMFKIMCLCKCGNKKSILLNNVAKATTKSCGCAAKESNKANGPKISAKKRTELYEYRIKYPRLYRIYKNMLNRCYNSNDPTYKYYGGRGVVVCDEWRKNSSSFMKWGIANGFDNHLQLDKDIIGDGKEYSPTKCCFVTSQENNRHRKDTSIFNYKGKMMCLREICLENNVSYQTVRGRIYKMSLEKALSMPFGIKLYPFNGKMLRLSEIAKLIGCSVKSLRHFVSKCGGIEDGISNALKNKNLKVYR